MYYRMTRLHFAEDRFEDLLDWAKTVKERVLAIDGLLFADLVKTGAGEGMVLAAYESEAAFQKASGTVSGMIEEMSSYLTDTPHGHAGTVALSFKTPTPF
jgi:hypothetical protein